MAAAPSAEAAARRRQARREDRRARIQHAARRLFAERGLEASTMRAVAEAAGYSVGALYSYYPSKEALLGEVYAEILGELARALRQQGNGSGRPAELRAATRALHRYWRDRPQAFALVLQLAASPDAPGLPPGIQRQINGRLISALQPIAEALRAATACPPAAAERETVLLAATVWGILVLRAGGRLAMLGQDEERLVDQAVDDLLERRRGGDLAGA